MNKINSEIFPEANHPRIYAYSDTNFQGCLKVGFTTRTVAERMSEHYPTKLPNQPYNIVLVESAIRNDGKLFKDHEVHKALEKMKIQRINGEWFKCELNDVKAAILAVKTQSNNHQKRTANFKMRPEQHAAVEKASNYFESYRLENLNRSSQTQKTPHFLWNAKMRFGKTFAAYQLAKKMHWKKVLILTFKPAVQSAWQEDLNDHLDFQGWQFISPDITKEKDFDFDKRDKSTPLVCFGSFQDYLGKNKAGGIKTKNEWVHETHWDCVIFDEYHYGAWTERSKELFEDLDAEDEIKKYQKREADGLSMADEIIALEENMPITTNHYLYLSGTPFRAISSGEFIEEQIFNWTYSDEQRAKESWDIDHTEQKNPYLSLSKMMLLTYKLPSAIQEIALKGEFDEFDLNEFFKATGQMENAHFKYEEQVQKWLDLIRGAMVESHIDTLKMGSEKPAMPFSDIRLLQNLNHTFWFLPNVAACYAMGNLLKQKQNTFYQDYEVMVCAGTKAGIGLKALEPVEKAISKDGSKGLNNKTITLSCGKLTTGVSVKQWTGIFMLRNLTSPESYFQAAFRVQTPWVLQNENDPNDDLILKNQCYVFDFAPNRALRQIADYSCRLSIENSNAEQKVAEFIKFLPVLAFDGSSMKSIDAAGVLDMAMSGTTATLLAKRWESALLVNVDNGTLQRLMNNPDAMKALMSIEGFRGLNEDIETIINKSESIKKAKAEASERDLEPKEKKQLNADEKEFKSKRKEIQEKLMKFATRIPVFMYLSDYREEALKDVIQKLEPDLFERVTGVTQPDFDLLLNLGVFNGSLMNDAIYKFKRYEESSLEYSGIAKQRNQQTGLWDTVMVR